MTVALASHRRVATIWAFSLVLVWVVVAMVLRQSIFTSQVSADLVPFGVFKGRFLTLESAWRLLASQWLHVKFAHMLLNALILGVVGTALATATSNLFMVTTGVAGGMVGQWVSAVAYPDSFVSGASQACLAIAGAALLNINYRSASWWLAILSILVSLAIDLFVSTGGTIKAGHVAALLFGLAAGMLHRTRSGFR